MSKTKVCKVRINFEGSVEVEVRADPEDAEAWSQALGKAWAKVAHRDISEAASLVGHDLLDEDDEGTDEGEDDDAAD